MPKKNDDRLLCKKVGENDRFIYTIREDGQFLRTRKSNWREEYVRPFLKRGLLCVNVNGIGKRLDKIVAEAFLPNYCKGDELSHTDGDIKNCAASNLTVISNTEYLMVHRKKRPGYNVLANGQMYPSIRDFAHRHYVDPGTVRNYVVLGRKWTKSRVLPGMSIEIVEKELEFDE